MRRDARPRRDRRVFGTGGDGRDVPGGREGIGGEVRPREASFIVAPGAFDYLTVSHLLGEANDARRIRSDGIRDIVLSESQGGASNGEGRHPAVPRQQRHDVFLVDDPIGIS